jgi:uncharacterized phosphosugar-binding protein
MTAHAPVRLDDVAAHAPALLAPATTAAAVNAAVIATIGAEIAARVRAGGRLFAFGAGHAYAFAAELCSRAGGLPDWTAMNLDDLRAEPRPAHVQLRDSMPERQAGNGPALGELYGLARGDVLLLASQSGRNASQIELAGWARERGVFVVAVTSLEHAAAFPSRHPSGRRLPDVAEAVLDLCTPAGDAVLRDGRGHSVAAASTIAFALLAQLLNARVTLELERAGVDPRVIHSANIDEDAM